MDESSVISTKTRIKQEAFLLFGQKGYYGTTIGDIAQAVGIQKGSLYAHYAGKDEIFLAVYQEVVQGYAMLFERLMNASKDMSVADNLHYNFKEYILHFYHNPHALQFGNMCWFHTTQELYQKTFTAYAECEKRYSDTLKQTFAAGMEQGIIRKDDPQKKLWSFRAKVQGTVLMVCKAPELTDENIDDFWYDFWFGIIERGQIVMGGN